MGGWLNLTISEQLHGPGSLNLRTSYCNWSTEISSHAISSPVIDFANSWETIRWCWISQSLSTNLRMTAIASPVQLIPSKITETFCPCISHFTLSCSSWRANGIKSNIVHRPANRRPFSSNRSCNNSSLLIGTPTWRSVVLTLTRYTCCSGGSSSPAKCSCLL